MVLRGDGELGRRHIGFVVGPPEPLPRDPIPEFAEPDLLRREFRAQRPHHLVERHAHRRLLLVLRDGHHIELRAGGGGQVVCDPVEHRVRHRVGVDLPKECHHREGAGRARPDLGGGIVDPQRDVAAQPGAVDLVAHFPGVDLREGRNEIDEPLLVLRARVLPVVAGVHRLPEDFEPLRFRVGDERRVGGRPHAGVEHDADPAVGRCEGGGEVEVRLVVRDRVDREAQPGHEGGLVVAGENGAVLRKQRIERHAELVERQLAGFALRRLGAVNIHRVQLRRRRVIGCGEFRRAHIVRPRREGRIQPPLHIPRRLVGEVDRPAGGEASPAVVEDEQVEPARERRPVERQRHRLRRDVECEVRPRGVERPAGDRPQVGGVQKEVAVVGEPVVVRDRPDLRRRELRAVAVEKQERHGPTSLRGAPHREEEPDQPRQQQQDRPGEQDFLGGAAPPQRAALVVDRDGFHRPQRSDRRLGRAMG